MNTSGVPSLGTRAQRLEGPMASATTAGFPSSSSAHFASRQYPSTTSNHSSGPSSTRQSYSQPVPSPYGESPNPPHLRPELHPDDGSHRGDELNHSRRPPSSLDREAEVDKIAPARGEDASPDHKRQRIRSNIPSLGNNSSATGSSTQMQASESLAGDHKDILRRRRSSSLRPSRKVQRRVPSSAIPEYRPINDTDSSPRQDRRDPRLHCYQSLMETDHKLRMLDRVLLGRPPPSPRCSMAAGHSNVLTKLASGKLPPPYSRPCECSTESSRSRWCPLNPDVVKRS